MKHEIEQINEMIADVGRGHTELGALVLSRLSAIAREMTRWQWVLHGDTSDFRAAVTRWLGRNSKLKAARRFALCGRGDQLGLEIGGSGARVGTKGCGCRFCPRCSKKSGRRALKRATSFLSARPHGEMWHLVFTQDGNSAEKLVETRARFEAAWRKAYRKMQADGMTGGLGTYHCVRSHGGFWHWHLHVIAEFAPGVDGKDAYKRYRKYWAKAKGEEGEGRLPLFGRPICGPGPAMIGLAGDSQMDLWNESENEVEKTLQYALRDVLQGTERWVKEVQTIEQVEEFCVGLDSCKLHRFFGEWRKKPEAVESEKPTTEQGVKEKNAPGTVAGERKVFEWIGTMDQVMWLAHEGNPSMREGLRRLLAVSMNQGSVAARLRGAIESLLR